MQPNNIVYVNLTWIITCTQNIEENYINVTQNPVTHTTIIPQIYNNFRYKYSGNIMVIALVLVFVCGSAANTGSSVPFIPQSQLESEIQILKQQINQEVQLRLELEQTFLMHIRLLRELKEDFIKTVDTLKNELKMNVSSFLKMAEGKVADLELGFMRNLSIARKGEEARYISF